jgi:hypothetical protein
MGKATRAAVARAYEVYRGNGGGESGAQESGEGGGGGGGGWLSSLSAAAPEVPPDAESESADRGVPGCSKDEPRRQQGRANEAKHGRGRGGGWGRRTTTKRRTRRRTRRRARRKAVRIGARRRMGRAAWTRRAQPQGARVRNFRYNFRPLSQGNNGSRQM